MEQLIQGMFDRNNQEIADLRNEFEKRNPTQTEKLNLRSLDSYPFKVKLTDYWKGKEVSEEEYQTCKNDLFKPELVANLPSACTKQEMLDNLK